MLKNIPIGNITALPNYRQIDEEPAEMDHLVASVKKDGLLQPVLVRTHKTEKDQYELIFGNRRFAAAKLAALETIPAQIKEVADDDILEVQVIENLQRKDVHPMDEAAAYKAYKEKHGCDVKELAAKFSKHERYIAHRLALSTLIPELQKDFLKKLLTIAQAEVFAKLNPEQQKELMKNETQWSDKYSSDVKQLHDKINRMFMRNLGKAVFDKTDVSLLPKAGSCTTCQKRTACKTLLFDDVAKEDHCLDGKCFSMKLDLHLVKKANDIIAHEPDISFAVEEYSNDTTPKRILDEAKKMKVPVHTTGWSFTKYHHFTLAKKVFMLNGTNRGKVVTVYFEQKKVPAGKNNEQQSVAMQIDSINKRLNRAGELLYEKYMADVFNLTDDYVEDDDAFKKNWDLQADDRFTVLLHYWWFDQIYNWDNSFIEAIGLAEVEDGEHSEKPELLFNKLLKMKEADKLKLFAKAFLDRIGKTTNKNAKSFMFEKFAEWIGMDLAPLRFAMNAELEKKQLSAASRIEKLEKELPKAKAKKAAAAPSPKKAAKKK